MCSLCWGHYEKERVYQELDTAAIKLTFELWCFKTEWRSIQINVTMRQIKLWWLEPGLACFHSFRGPPLPWVLGEGLLILCILCISTSFFFFFLSYFPHTQSLASFLNQVLISNSFCNSELPIHSPPIYTITPSLGALPGRGHWGCDVIYLGAADTGTTLILTLSPPKVTLKEWKTFISLGYKIHLFSTGHYS